jgi:hypothetical protein
MSSINKKLLHQDVHLKAADGVMWETEQQWVEQ